MPTNPPSKWWWTWADSRRSPATWRLLEDSESRLLEHAHRESWGRLEFYIDGVLYVINEFSPNSQTHLAVPLENGGIGKSAALLTRALSAPTEGQCCSLPAQGLEGSRPAHWSPASFQDGAENKSKILAQPGCRRNNCSTSSDSSGHASSARHPSSVNIPAISLDFDGFQLVRHRRRRRGFTNQAASPARKPAKAGQVAVWRAFPKVDLEACDDYHVIRQVLVDGVDIALRHGGRRKLSPAGIAAAVAHFTELSFPVRVVVPQWLAQMHKEHTNLFTESPGPLLEALQEDDMLVVLPDPGEPNWYPSRARLRAASDSEYTIELCKIFNAAYCSNDFSQFLHLLDSSPPRYDDYLYMTTRSCLYAFDGNNFYHILDSLGRGKFVDGLFFRNRRS